MVQRSQWSTINLGVLLILACGVNGKDDYRGKPLGKLSQLNHGVSGEVYAVDARTLHIRNFNYDGEGPAAYFYVGTSKAPSGNGIRIRDERGTTNVLPRYKNKDITLSLPEGMSLQNIRWFSVWCDEFSVNFGDVRIPKNFDFPRPHKLGALNGIHGVSSDQVVIVDAQTLLIPNFSYDGEAPDAKFWVGQGSRPTPQGIRVADENGKEAPLRRYDRKTIVLTLPGDMTVFDIGHFGVWCEAFAVDFAHVLLPQGLNVPPSLRMLGVSPQKRSRSLELPNYIQNNVNEESRQEPVAKPIFYHEFKAGSKASQVIKPTTYRPQLLRPVFQQQQQQQQQLLQSSASFEIQQSISVPHNNEFVIHEDTGEFVKPQQIQYSRRHEIRYEPTPAEKILQANPSEFPSGSNYENNQIQQGPFAAPPQAQFQIPVNQAYIRQQPSPVYIQQQTSPTYAQQPTVTHLVPPQPSGQFIQPQQQLLQPEPAQLVQPPPANLVQQPLYQQRETSPTTNHFGKLFNQQNVESSVNHAPHLGSGSFSRFVINRSTDAGYYHRY